MLPGAGWGHPWKSGGALRRGAAGRAFIPCTLVLVLVGQRETLGWQGGRGVGWDVVRQSLLQRVWRVLLLGPGSSLGSPNHCCVGEQPICPFAGTDAISLPPHLARGPNGMEMALNIPEESLRWRKVRSRGVSSSLGSLSEL